MDKIAVKGAFTLSFISMYFLRFFNIIDDKWHNVGSLLLIVLFVVFLYLYLEK